MDGRKNGFIEVYKAKRYFTVTGNVYGELKPINERYEQVMQIFDKYFNNSISVNSNQKAEINNSCNKKDKGYLSIGLEKDAVFKSLWNGEYQSEKCISESEKDLALMGKLLYWCSGNVGTAIEAFKDSPYARGKDDRHTAKLERSDYLQRTAMKAMQGLTSTAILDDGQFIRSQEFSLDDMGNAKRLVSMYGGFKQFIRCPGFPSYSW